MPRASNLIVLALHGKSRCCFQIVEQQLMATLALLLDH
jgi:hypothetical protein